MNVLVTGAAGFVGSRLCEALLGAGYHVTGVDALTDYYDVNRKRRNLARLSSTRFDFVSCLLQQCDLVSLLRDVDAVFHLAGQPGVRQSWSTGFDSYVNNNVAATQMLLEAIRVESSRSGTAPRLIYASSSSVYGNALTYPTVEGLMPEPFSPYGVTKLAAEHLVSVYAKNFNIPAVSLRYFTVYGGGQRPDMAVQRMIEAAMNGSEFQVYGDGTQRRDFTHVADVVAANLSCMDASPPLGSVVNIAGGSDLTVLDLLQMVEDVVGKAVPVQFSKSENGDVGRTSGDTSLAATLLGWSPKVEFRDGLLEQFEYERTMGRNV